MTIENYEATGGDDPYNAGVQDGIHMERDRLLSMQYDDIDGQILRAVENEIGGPHDIWNLVDPCLLILAAVKCAVKGVPDEQD